MQTGFSILIPTWNNCDCLKLCINSIQRNSLLKHQILVFVNEGNDETPNWLKSENIEFIYSPKNIGICYAMNQLATIANKEFLVYMNDDMVALPGWDISFQKAIDNYKDDLFFLSSTLIEPRKTTNPNLPIIVADFGDSPENFNENKLIEQLPLLIKKDWNGASWPVSLISKRIWNLVGGYSIEFSPGMYSDPDFSMKLWQAGIREFRGLGDCFFYHFGSKSTKRIKKNAGSSVFLNKWRISAKTFYRIYLKMGTDWNGPLSDVELSGFLKLRYFLKRKFWAS